MKKFFSFEETVTYVHQIEVDIDETRLDEFEKLAAETADNIDSIGVMSDKEGIAARFKRRFGEDKVILVIDGSPAVEYNAF
ncbi:MAG: hypothetical protein NC548_38785 [Lachnospiraceae bacterium]|nr:hypothetical protein [Lachnospiraceae bacterium]